MFFCCITYWFRNNIYIMFSKTNFHVFLNKGGIDDKLIGGAKGFAGLLDEPLVQAGISALSPEIAFYGALKRTGLLEKFKH